MSTLTVATVKSNSSSPPVFQNTSGTEVGTLCRAWVNFEGTGTVAINANKNVSSITDNGNGDYTVNFTNAMPDANYSTVVTTGNNSGTSTSNYYGCVKNAVTAPTASAVRVYTGYGGTGYDLTTYVAIFR